MSGQRDESITELPEIGEPPAMEAAYQRLGLTPASDEDFASLVDEMGAPDAEG
jgi:hypothetical protein